MLSIRFKITLIIISIVLAITASSLATGLFFSQNRFWDTVRSDLAVSSEIAARMIAGEMEVLKRDVRIVGTHLELAGKPEITEQLRYYTNNGPYLSLAIFDRKGWVDFYGHAAPSNSYLENGYMKRAFAGETMISPPEWESGGNLVMRIWEPLADGRVLIATIPGLTVSRKIASFKIWETGNIFVIDREGFVIANVRENWVTQRYNFIRMSETDPQFQSPAAVVSRMIRGETGIGNFAINGLDRIVAYRPVDASDGWALGVVAPIAESPVSQIGQVLLISSAVILGLGIIAAVFAARSVAVPYKKIEEQNIRLEELREMAENASEAKSRFLANMSHEMRTPLNAIIGLVELELGSENLSGEILDNTEQIYNSGMILLGIINDLLDISKIESGKFEIIPVEYNVPSLINDTINLNIVRIGSKPIKFRIHAEEHLPAKLLGDELRIKQIFNNLLSNAFKYTNEGAVDWYIEARKEGDEVWLESRVEDTGIGIRKEDIPKLFTDYSQVDAKSNRKIEGTGLGLSITRRMAELMGGKVTVESEYGRGSVFTVRIRQEAVGEGAIGRDVAANLGDFNYTLQRRSRNQKLIRTRMPYASVLVVDDMPVNLEVAKGMLRPYGMTVDCVSSGHAAISRIREGSPRYSAVFMDHMMPEMDGMEATRIIREEIGTGYAKNIPVIALTADAIAGNDKIFLNRGFQAFLTKPIDIMQLDLVLNRWVRDKKQEKELKAKESETGALDEAAARREVSLREAAKGISGFDIDRGLTFVGGDVGSWLDVVRSFVSHTPSLLDSLQNLGRENLADFTITVHGIKGACYSLGAAAAGKAAEELEHKGRAGDFDFVRAHAGSFIAQAGKLLEDLGFLLKIAEDEDERPRKPVPDQDVLAAIREAAAAYDMESLETAVSALERYRYETEQDLVPWLREQCNKSEFTAIQERLAEKQNVD